MRIKMNQLPSTIENDVMTVTHADYEESMIRPERLVQVAHGDAESNPVAIEKYCPEELPALLFFWDGKKVHRITDERPKQEIARIIDNNL